MQITSDLFRVRQLKLAITNKTNETKNTKLFQVRGRWGDRPVMHEIREHRRSVPMSPLHRLPRGKMAVDIEGGQQN